MRSRYAAYALGEVRYILDTTHPDGPQHQRDRATWRAEVQAFCDRTTFEALEIVSTGEEGDDAWVTFRAHLAAAGRRHVMEERSRFKRHKGRWSYHAPWGSGASPPR